ncbi:hypothetical protein F5146DRAFT_1109815 [Armillaria mellea]|nr:hypothetical protein F5146DRAFT_1109815 [Armillaria mellea]
MDDSLQFIIESPQNAQGHKKRPRLVTSCDNCRLKKIKCLQPSPETKCEACKTAKIPCRFRDRERYFAERSRAIAGPSGGQGYDERSSDSSLDAFSLSPSHSSSLRPSGVVRPDGESRGRYPSFSSDPRPSHHSPSSSISSYSHSRSNSLGYNYMSSDGSPIYNSSRSQSPQQNSGAVVLFDSDQQHPHPSLMPNFIGVLFERMGSEFKFFTYGEVAANYGARRLSALLSNSIAALASQYTTVPELTVRGLHNVANAYSEHAKQLLRLMGHPSLDTLHALILLSWYEMNNSRTSAFRSYYQMAMNMAVDLGLSNPPVSMSVEDQKKKDTWNAVLRLHHLRPALDTYYKMFRGGANILDAVMLPNSYNSKGSVNGL